MTSPDFHNRMSDNRNREKESERIKSDLENAITTAIITAVCIVVGVGVFSLLAWLL